MSFPGWTKTPIPNFGLSAAGVIAIADLGTISARTAIVGSSSWLDCLLLAPGLHYQQATDAAVNDPQSYAAVENVHGRISTFNITNPATVRYLQRVGRAGEIVTVDVGTLPERFRHGRRRRRHGQRGTILRDAHDDFGWYSHVLYLASPILTVAAIVFMVLLQEWWGLSLLVALMLSRLMNIWLIKQRSKPPKGPLPSPDIGQMLTEYVVDLGNGRSVCLRGIVDDLQAITTSTWLRAKTHIEGYIEAMAKLIVFVVAAISGNMSQVGGIIFMGLLLISAGLLGLSNAHVKTFRMHGRIATPTHERLPYPPRKAPYPHSKETMSSPTATSSVSWPPFVRRESTGLTAMEDFAERGQIGAAVRNSHPFDRNIDYE